MQEGRHSSEGARQRHGTRHLTDGLQALHGKVIGIHNNVNCLWKAKKIRSIATTQLLGVIAIYEISGMAVRPQNFAVNEFLMKRKAAMAVSDWRHDDPINDKGKETVEKIFMDVFIVFRNEKVFRRVARKFIVQFVLVIDGFGHFLFLHDVCLSTGKV